MRKLRQERAGNEHRLWISQGEVYLSQSRGLRVILIRMRQLDCNPALHIILHHLTVMSTPTRRQMRGEEVAGPRVAEIGISYRLWRIERWKRVLSTNRSGIEKVQAHSMLYHLRPIPELGNYDFRLANGDLVATVRPQYRLDRCAVQGGLSFIPRLTGRHELAVTYVQRSLEDVPPMFSAKGPFR